eukprot:jgi/Pico_ML_1/51083/g2171.t1
MDRTRAARAAPRVERLPAEVRTLRGRTTVCTVDMALAPKLHHMDLVLKEFKNWEVPEDMPAVKKYIALMRERPSFKATHYDNEIVYMG